MSVEPLEPPLAWIRSSLRSRRTRKRGVSRDLLQVNFRSAGLFGGRGRLTHRVYGLSGIGKSGVVDAVGG